MTTITHFSNPGASATPHDIHQGFSTVGKDTPWPAEDNKYFPQYESTQLDAVALDEALTVAFEDLRWDLSYIFEMITWEYHKRSELNMEELEIAIDEYKVFVKQYAPPEKHWEGGAIQHSPYGELCHDLILQERSLKEIITFYREIVIAEQGGSDSDE